ncbi:hypothetical protein HI914_01023 [Erysiphe necator]|nr:hypothetical protein HI914_01023 [Erysiphe necator]
MNFKYHNTSLFSSLTGLESAVSSNLMKTLAKSLGDRRFLKLKQNSTASIARSNVRLTLESRSKSTLPAQIGGIIGAYILSVIIVCIIIYIIASRLRYKLRAALETFDVDRIESPFPENLNANDRSTLKKSKISRIIKVKERYNRKIKPSPHDFPAPKSGSPTFEMGVIETDRQALSGNLEDISAHVMAQEEVRMNQATSTHISPSPLSAEISKIKAFSKSRHSIYGNKVSQKISNSKVFTKAIPRFSSLLLRLKPSKVEKKKSRNLKISLPIPRPFTGCSTIHNDQIASSITQSYNYSYPRISQDNQYELSEVSSPGDPGKCHMNSFASSRKSNFWKSQQNSDALNLHSNLFSSRSLPLRQYDSSTQSSIAVAPTRTTVLDREARPIYPEAGSLEIPQTARSIPYSPYEPLSMTIPITPTFLTKEERKRRKNLKPKIPSFELVKSDAELWDGAYDSEDTY